MSWRFPGKFKKTLAIISGSLFFLCIAFILSVYSGFWGPLPNKEALAEERLDLATVILDHRGQTLGKLFREDRHPVHYDDLPVHLTEALIATEDTRFYEHDGTDTRSLFRVLFKTVILGDASSGGGSTLTQQLAKNLYGRKKMGKLGLLAHKFRESVIASRLEALYSKEEILEKYLNTVPFPDNTYGIESASRRFYSKPAAELSLSEAATLIGSLKATHTYNPRLFPERSRERRNVVLHQMVKYGKIDIETYEDLKDTPEQLVINPVRASNGNAAYFREQVRKELEDWAATYAEASGREIDLYTDGLQITTTLDLQMQTLAEEAMQRHMRELQASFEKSYGNQAPWSSGTALANAVIRSSGPYKALKEQGLSDPAVRDSLNRKSKRQLFTWKGVQNDPISVTDSLLNYLKLLNLGWVSMQPETGAVRTWIGGANFDYVQYDHVIQSKRQVGSVFKPIVYATALEQGIPACRYYDLRKVSYENLDGWTPENASEKDQEKYMNYSMEYALSHSVNTIAVKVMEDTGIDRVVETAKKLGITSELPEVPSLALGTAELSVLEVATAYTAFLNNGIAATPYMIEEIRDKNGNVLYRHDRSLPPRETAFSERTSQLMLQMLQSVVQQGTAKRLSDVYGVEGTIAGKTGTTQQNKDGWFVALTPDLVSVSWVGLDDQRLGFRSTAIGQGANSALPLFAIWWKELQRSGTHRELTAAAFTQPDEEILEALDCDPKKKDGFFKRLFKNPNKTRSKEFKGITTPSK